MAEIKCGCGKLLARYDNGTLYLWCKGCKREIALPVDALIKPSRTKSRSKNQSNTANQSH